MMEGRVRASRLDLHNVRHFPVRGVLNRVVVPKHWVVKRNLPTYQIEEALSTLVCCQFASPREMGGRVGASCLEQLNDGRFPVRGALNWAVALK